MPSLALPVPEPAVEEKLSRTQHVVTLDGERISYTATAGTLVLRAEDGKPRASVFHIAYTKDGVKNPAERPVTFAFNGGPGGAAIWVHLGAFGPKRVDLDPEGFPLPPPGRLVENAESILDRTDLVFVDPVSTGFSRAAPGVDPKDFHGLENDIESMAEFIRLWITRNGRWGSPKFLAGESYATTRVAGLSEHLVTRHGMRLNGVILLSVVLNHQDHRFNVGNDMPYITFLPTYTAAAWYHKKLPPELSGDLHSTLKEVEKFAVEEYGPALLMGDWLPADRRQQVAEKLARYTGLSVDYVLLSNLRVEHARFCKELLRDQRQTIGRIDVRFTGTDLDAVGEIHEFDPSLTRLDAPFLETALDYLHRELGYREDENLVYERISQKVFPWHFPNHEGRYPNMAENLRQAMMKNPDMQVLIVSGHYDLATPYFAAEYSVAHMGLPEADRKRVHFAYYDSGHMQYIRREDHRKLKRDVAEFIRNAAP
ncbi:MAG TPA: peptidase S10 [Thermoanaerobaculia bacterium]|nr:peptidase S10 [Thermoanaerobaculia bacterium]